MIKVTLLLLLSSCHLFSAVIGQGPQAPFPVLRANGSNAIYTQANGATAPTTQRMNIFRNSRGNVDDYSAARAGCITIGYGMTSNELTALDNIVSETQTILDRRVL